jgi:hypothetical protein
METRHTHREIDKITIGRDLMLTLQVIDGIRRREERESRKGAGILEIFKRIFRKVKL